MKEEVKIMHALDTKIQKLQKELLQLESESAKVKMRIQKKKDLIKHVEEAINQRAA